MNKEYTDALLELESFKRYHKMMCVLIWTVGFLACFGTYQITKMRYENALDSCMTKLQNYADTFITPIKHCTTYEVVKNNDGSSDWKCIEPKSKIKRGGR